MPGLSPASQRLTRQLCRLTESGAGQFPLSIDRSKLWNADLFSFTCSCFGQTAGSDRRKTHQLTDSDRSAGSKFSNRSETESAAVPDCDHRDRLSARHTIVARYFNESFLDADAPFPPEFLRHDGG
jgi:hypothetical protein